MSNIFPNNALSNGCFDREKQWETYIELQVNFTYSSMETYTDAIMQLFCTYYMK